MDIKKFSFISFKNLDCLVGVGSGVFTQLSVIGLTKDRSRRGKAGPGVNPEPVVLVFCPDVAAADVEGRVEYTAGEKCWEEGEIMYIISPLVLKNEILYIISQEVLDIRRIRFFGG